MMFTRIPLSLLLLIHSAVAVAPSRDLSAVLAAGGNVFDAAKVGPLPGINATSYSGFFNVNKTANAYHFFWYWPALNGNTSAPVIIWMQGGPGSSSLFACFTEMGPYRLSAQLDPIANPFAWNNEYNLVFLDNPRQTGYSYSDVGTLCTEWTCYGNDFDAFIRQFVVGFELTSNQMYIFAESFGGHYGPASAFTVLQNNAAGVQPLVNLQGVGIGNGFVAPYEMSQGYADIIFNAGLISPPEYMIAQSYVANITRLIENENYVEAYLVWDAFLNGDSTPGGAWFTNTTGITNYFNIATETPPEFGYFSQYVTSQAVRTAIGVGNIPFNDGNLQVELALKGDVMFSQKPRLEAILSAGIQVLIYNGALDLICGAPLTERYVPILDWPGNTGWNVSPKKLWHDIDFPGGGVISGYSRSFQNLNQVIIRGAGHMAPFDAPSRSLDLVSRFVNRQAFD